MVGADTWPSHEHLELPKPEQPKQSKPARTPNKTTSKDQPAPIGRPGVRGRVHNNQPKQNQSILESICLFDALKHAADRQERLFLLASLFDAFDFDPSFQQRTLEKWLQRSDFWRQRFNYASRAKARTTEEATVRRRRPTTDFPFLDNPPFWGFLSLILPSLLTGSLARLAN